MIKKFGVKNFKAFKDTGDIELKPMTVVAGPNSSGKTTILQSLLLLKQTLENKNPGVELDLDGRFMQLTSLKELGFGKPSSQKCEISYAFTLETEIPVKVAPRYFPNLTVSEESHQLSLLSDVAFSFRCMRAPGEKQRIQVAKFDLQTHLDDFAGPRFSFRYAGKEVTAQVGGAGIDRMQPGRDRKILAVGGAHFVPSFLLFKRLGNPPEERTQVAEVWLDQIFAIPLRELATELERNIRYLGPLREEPKPAYLHSGTSSAEIGKRGEFAAQILWLERNERILYKPSLYANAETVSLGNAVNDTFRRFGIADGIEVKSEESVTYQILFPLMGHKGKKHVTIADVGFGVSQLLPIVVMGLRSQSSSLLLFEQPEIHLHP
ncbi:MAG: hypothetical protein DRH70_05070, partial [Candidatus Coatesbacteria bacterium]